MELPLIVGVDGSDSSLRATDWAVDEAARHGHALRVVYASRWENYEGMALGHDLGRPSGQILAQHLVASAAERAQRRNPEVKVLTDIVPEDTVTALLREADGAFALVTGSHGRGAITGRLLGSVSLAVAARARCPVIVVRGDDVSIDGRHDRILLGVSDDAGTEAVRFAFREAYVRGCTIDAVRAWRCPAYESTDHARLVSEPTHVHEERASALLDRALADGVREYPSVRVQRTTVEGPAHKVLLQRAAAADLTIVGARRQSGHLGLQLGRVAHALLHHADCPVAVVPQHL
ncbi:universal stress protein [Streptomyces sp. AM8-1-1]|uniref:universal stress protein n=1 Tax=Streptomyces sp. AM8-1-1 TaxID=3075825 RepID=UPI0028C446BB|nr:universal stress protein [Streptomyces sp. AM8-1-1]WNO70273.1 universal stress protein [Streptomyces sp. AM8-1-1]